LVKVTGTWLRGKDIHDYKIPNNPDNNEWHNLALEDIGLFWDLPNFDECKFYYFRAVNLNSEASGAMLDIPTPVKADSKDDVITDYYGWRWHEDTHRWLRNSLGSFAAVSGVALMTTLSLM